MIYYEYSLAIGLSQQRINKEVAYNREFYEIFINVLLYKRLSDINCLIYKNERNSYFKITTLISSSIHKMRYYKN